MDDIFEAPGLIRIDKFVDIGTHKLHVVLSDLPSEFTIVLEAGGGKDSSSYQQLQDILAIRTGLRVMSYDRFGLDNLNAVTPYFSDPAKDHEKAGNRMVDFSSESFEAMRGKELSKEIPITLITSGIPPIMKELWRKCHEEMVINSEKHQLLIAEGSHHDIVEENPELVLRAVIELVNRVKTK